MKIKFKAKNLENSLKRIHELVDKVTYGPKVESHILLESENSVTYASIFNHSLNQIFSRVVVEDVQCLESGSVYIPYKNLNVILKNLIFETILLETMPSDDKEEEEVTLVNIKDAEGKYKMVSKLRGSNPEDTYIYINSEGHKIPDSKDLPIHEIDLENFYNAICKVSYAIASDDNKYTFNGLYINNEDNSNKLTMVATDGKRLSTTSLNFKSSSNFKHIIIPHKAISNLKKNLDYILKEFKKKKVSKEEEKKLLISFFISNNIIMFNTDYYSMYVKLIEGTPLEYKEIIPKDNNVKAIVPTLEFKLALKQAFATSQKNHYQTFLTFSNKNLNIYSETFKEFETDINISLEDKYETFRIAFSCKYLMETVAQIEGDFIEIHYKSDDFTKPVLFVDKDNLHFLHLIAPQKY